MKENLKVTKNPKGEAITRYCYDNDPKICETDGGLYDWNTAMNNSTTEGAQGICPNGWHVPKDSEWQKLADRNIDIKDLKSGGLSGFDGIFSGYRDYELFYNERGKKSNFWSSLQIARSRLYELRPDGTLPGPDWLTASAWLLESSHSNIFKIQLIKKSSAFSIRCLKN